MYGHRNQVDISPRAILALRTEFLPLGHFLKVDKLLLSLEYIGSKNFIWQSSFLHLKLLLHGLDDFVAYVVQRLKHCTLLILARDGWWRNYLATFGLVEESKRAFDVLVAFC
jgi:hypothetical protein